MFDFKTKEHRTDLHAIKEAETIYKVMVLSVEPVMFGDAPDVTLAVVCSCDEMKRGQLCRHYNSAIRRWGWREVVNVSPSPGEPMILLPMWGGSPTVPMIFAPVMVRENYLHIVTSDWSLSADVEVVNGEWTTEQVGVCLPGDKLFEVRAKVIEWLSALPYTDSRKCLHPGHSADSAPSDDPMAHFDRNTGTFSRYCLADLLTVHTDRLCIDCYQTIVPFDFDDNERSW